MKKNRTGIVLALVVISVFLGLFAFACAPKSSEGPGGAGGGAGSATAAAGTGSSAGTAEPGFYPTGSLMSLHASGVINPEQTYTKKDCLTCHPRDTIIAATARYGGEEDVNPHAAHTEAYDCTVCHSVVEESSLKCNACHNWALPDGWVSPPKESSAPSGR